MQLQALTVQLWQYLVLQLCTSLLSQLVTCRPQSKIQAEKWRAHGSMFTTQAVFALWYIVGHAVLSENDPLTFALLREMLSAIALLTLAQTTEGDIRIQSKGDLIDICVLVRGSLHAALYAAELLLQLTQVAHPVIMSTCVIAECIIVLVWLRFAA